VKKLIVAAMHPASYRWGLRPWKRHSLVLLVAGAVYVGMGVAYAATAATASRESALVLAINLMSLSSWGIVWIVVGALAVFSSRWPPASETWGYALLSALSTWWSTCYVYGVATGAENQSITGGLLWGLVAFLWWAIAGLMNPDPDLVLLHEDDARHGTDR